MNRRDLVLTSSRILMALPTNWLTQGSSPFPLQRIKSNTFNLGGGERRKGKGVERGRKRLTHKTRE